MPTDVPGLLSTLGPPGEWSGAVAGAVPQEQRQDLLRAWRSMSAEERNTIVAKWRERFNAPADKTAEAYSVGSLHRSDTGRWTPAKIHALADRLGVKWDNDIAFMDACEKQTGKRHLDAMSPGQLSSVASALEKTAEVEYRGRTFPGYNQPVDSDKKEKKMMVLAKKGEEVRLIHFGQKGYKHNYSPAAKANYLSRSAGIRNKSGQLTKDDPFSPNYWARRVLWPKGDTGGGGNGPINTKTAADAADVVLGAGLLAGAGVAAVDLYRSRGLGKSREELQRILKAPEGQVDIQKYMHERDPTVTTVTNKEQIDRMIKEEFAAHPLKARVNRGILTAAVEQGDNAFAFVGDSGKGYIIGKGSLPADILEHEYGHVQDFRERKANMLRRPVLNTLLQQYSRTAYDKGTYRDEARAWELAKDSPTKKTTQDAALGTYDKAFHLNRGVLAGVLALNAGVQLVAKHAALPASKEHREAVRRVDTHFRSNDPKKWDTLMDSVQRKSFVAATKQDTRADPKFERHVDQMGRLLTGKAIGKVGQYNIVRMRGGGIGCTCPDWRYKKSVAGAGEQDCKHIVEFKATRGAKTADVPQLLASQLGIAALARSVAHEPLEDEKPLGPSRYHHPFLPNEFAEGPDGVPRKMHEKLLAAGWVHHHYDDELHPHTLWPPSSLSLEHRLAVEHHVGTFNIDAAKRGTNERARRSTDFHHIEVYTPPTKGIFGLGARKEDVLKRYKVSPGTEGRAVDLHYVDEGQHGYEPIKTASVLSTLAAHPKSLFAAGTAAGVGALALGLRHNTKSTQFTPAQKQMRSFAMHEVAGLGMLASPYVVGLAEAGAEALATRPGRVGVAARAAHSVLQPLSHVMHGEGHTSPVLHRANELLGLGVLALPSLHEMHHLNSQMKKHGMAAVDRTEVLNDVGFHTGDNRYVTLTDKKYLSALADGHIKDNKVFKVPHDVQRLHERLHDQGLKLPHKDAAIYLGMEHAAAQTPGGNRIKVPGEAHAPVHLVGDHGVLRDLGNLTWSPDKKGRGILTTFRTPEMRLRTPLTGQSGRSTLLADVFSHEPKLVAEHKELRNAARRFLGASIKSL